LPEFSLVCYFKGFGAIPTAIKGPRPIPCQRGGCIADQATLEQLTAKAKAGCPVSRWLNAAITLDAILLP